MVVSIWQIALSQTFVVSPLTMEFPSIKFYLRYFLVKWATNHDSDFLAIENRGAFRLLPHRFTQRNVSYREVHYRGIFMSEFLFIEFHLPKYFIVLNSIRVELVSLNDFPKRSSCSTELTLKCFISKNWDACIDNPSKYTRNLLI